MARYRESTALSILKGGKSTVTAGAKGEVYFGKETAVIPVGRAGKKKIEIDKTASLADAIAMAYTWSDVERKAFVAKARALGYDDVTDLTSPNLWAMAVNGASEWYKNSNGQVRITPEEYLEWYAKSKGVEAQGPSVSKTITQYGAPQIRDWINDGLTRRFGRTFESLNQEERSILFQAVKEYSDKAAVSTSRRGAKGETITTVQPGATTAGIQEVIQQTAMDIPGLVSDKERQDRINFSDWLTKNAPGA
jgi:hypothetical protein